jgi:hypothetical protein
MSRLIGCIPLSFGAAWLMLGASCQAPGAQEQATRQGSSADAAEGIETPDGPEARPGRADALGPGALPDHPGINDPGIDAAADGRETEPAPADARTPADSSAATPSSGAIAHRFLKGFSGGGSVALVGRDGALEWELEVAEPEANDAWMMASGNVLFGFRTGCREVNRAGETVWELRAAAGAEIHSCQPLEDGWTLVGESRGDGSSHLYEVDRAKRMRKTIAIQWGGSAHNQLRQVRKTRQNTYLVTQQRGGGKALEYDGDGKLLRSFPCGSFVAIRLPDGNTLIACGDEHRVIEVDPRDQVVWQVNENDIPGNRLGFAAGLQRLANGNTVICNWSGHSGLADQPQVIEVTRDKKVVWQVKDSRLNKITSIQILDAETLVDGVALR